MVGLHLQRVRRLAPQLRQVAVGARPGEERPVRQPGPLLGETDEARSRQACDHTRGNRTPVAVCLGTTRTRDSDDPSRPTQGAVDGRRSYRGGNQGTASGAGAANLLPDGLLAKATPER